MKVIVSNKEPEDKNVIWFKPTEHVDDEDLMANVKWYYPMDFSMAVVLIIVIVTVFWYLLER